MRKILLIVFSVFLLSACSDVKDSNGGNVKGEETNNALGELKADSSDFNGSGFKNKNGQYIAWVDTGLQVGGAFQPEAVGYTTDIDTVIEKESAEHETFFNKIYEHAEIKTDGLKYFIELDQNISLEFEKVGERIIKDSKGVEYYTEEYSN